MQNKYINIINKIVIIIIMLLTAMSIIVRVFMCVNHFTHYDDIGFLAFILNGAQNIWDKINYNRNIVWTYAPLQCVLSALLINTEYSYNVNLFLGRLPSLLFSVATLISVMIYVKRNNDQKQRIVYIFPLTMIGFSWEQIIYASQAEPYAISAFAIMVLILFLQGGTLQKHYYLRLVLISSIMGYISYQLFIFVLVLYTVLAVSVIRDISKLLKTIWCGIIALFIDLPVVFMFLKTGMISHGTNWNVGINGDFSFNSNNDSALNIIQFWLKNTIVWVRSMFVYNRDALFANVLSIGIICLIIIGIYRLIKAHSIIGYFIVLSMLFNVMLIVMGKLSYSPSRHNLVFTPLACVLTVNGWFELNKKRKALSTAVLIIPIVSLAIFICTFKDEYIERENMMSEEVVEAWIKEYNPLFIGEYKDTFDIELMHINGYHHEMGGLFRDEGIFTCGEIIILYSRAQSIDEDNLKFFDNYLNGKRLELLTSTEKDSDVEVEYARDCFFNYRNGYYRYIYIIEE